MSTHVSAGSVASRLNKRTWVVLALLVVFGVGAPFVLSSYSLQLTALFLPLAILAISLDLLWGENRLISFGQGAFFAAGGYMGGLILLGHSYNPIGGAASFLSSGGSSSGLDHLLSNLHSVQIAGIPVAALVLPPVILGAIGLVIGMIVFRVADPQIYLPLITLGIGVVAELWFNDAKMIGGSNGLGGIPSFVSTTTGQYIFNAAFLAAVLFAYWAFRRSVAGSTWRALGDDPVRLEALGYPVRRMRACGFAVSVAIAGLAGSLYGGTVAVIGPSLSDITFSAQPLIWIVVGGTGTLLGPVVGTLLVQWLQQELSSSLGLQDSWQLVLGAIFVVMVIVAPGGLLGSRREGGVLARLPRRTPRPPTPAATGGLAAMGADGATGPRIEQARVSTLPGGQRGEADDA